MQVYKLIPVGLLVICLTGCATSSETSSESADESVTPTEESQRNASVKELSSGKEVTITTSQGTLSVEPTVVAITDAPGDPEQSQDVYYNDPWEGLNRAIFGFNHYLYDYVLIPASDGYHYAIPAAVRDKIGNAFDNIREPLNLISNLAAGEVDEAGANVGRFLINTTVGIFGLFDPATHWFDIQPHKQTIGDTLTEYQVASGPYLVLPVLGPSDVRGTFSVVTEGVIHPINQISNPPESYQIRMVDGFDDFSEQADTYRTLYKNAEDPYIFFRNQFIQGQRRDEFFEYGNGNQDKE